MVRRYVAILAGTLCLLAHGVIYPAVGVVTAVDYETDTVTVEKANGHAYEFYGVEDLMPGDVMALLMYSNGTPYTQEDDAVISARYGGYVIEEMKGEDK